MRLAFDPISALADGMPRRAAGRFVHIFLILLAAPAQAVVLSVGSDAGCSHATVQAAVDALPADGMHEIRVRSGTWSAQAIAINSRSVTIRGGYTSCAQSTPTGTTILSGLGGAAASVLGIGSNLPAGTGIDIVLENLSLVRGDDTFYGGGIEFRAYGTLTLRKVGIAQNTAGYGGGIYFFGDPDTKAFSELRIESDTVIQLNTATYGGGGIKLVANARLVMLHDRTMISGNEALMGDGGGILAESPAQVDIASPGFGTSGAINNNRARFGGGLALVERDWIYGDITDSTSRLFSTFADRPVRIHNNLARQGGGGIYTRSVWFDGEARSRINLHAWDFRVDGNRAPQGSAILASSDGAAGGHVILNGGTSGIGQPRPVSLGAVACAAGAACNRIDGNVAAEESGTPTTGAAVFVTAGTDALLDVERTAFSNNTGGEAVRSYADDLFLYNSLVSGNTLSGHVIRQDKAGAIFAVTGTTIAGNVFNSTHAIRTAGPLSLRRSILWQPGKALLLQDQGALDVAELIVNETGTLGGAAPTLVASNPRFVDPARGDFHLQPASPAVDFALASSGVDLDGVPRGGDFALVPNRFGPGDIGAYELTSLEPILLNGNFNADLNLWTAGVYPSGWDGTQNAPGNPTPSGALRVNYDPIIGGLTGGPTPAGRWQCRYLPGPGVYEVNGSAKVSRISTPPFSINSALLRWELRHSTSPTEQSCANGTPDRSGSIVLASGTAWNRPANAVLIDVPVSAWTRNTSLTVELVVSPETAQTALSGWFDAITVVPRMSDVIFADDFE